MWAEPKTIRVGNRMIGPGQPVYIVAEVGTTANGSLETALKLVDVAADSGVDALKFMMIDPDAFMSDRSVSYTYATAEGKREENMYEMFKSLMFSPEEWRQIAMHAKIRNVTWFATVDFLAGVDQLISLGCPAIKLSSWDATNYPLIERMASTGLPLFVDAGPVDLAELASLCGVARGVGNDDMVLLHCTHATVDSEVNLLSIPYIRETFNAVVGYSADEREVTTDIAAIALGASVIEKRVTMDCNYPGHHHLKAIEPSELRDYVSLVRRLESMMGRLGVFPSSEDCRLRNEYMVSIVADRDLEPGEVISADALACRRPGTGLSPRYLSAIVGRRTSKRIGRNEILTWDHL